ncbi:MULTISPECIES: hypothetical protein [unclassified Lactobacillus]|uniref:hypothetical protein n=1 Tax=unclassified Lactobacillus TaxID=2620435 RepID=UPI000EFBF7C5|nr:MULTISPECIES: hypothetical protein [unclassified Lactobacillus]RMC26310.1 hypothetical protein F5ESL0247_00165 [Lactobacillus sp. ESL0247]RMC29848.1 hypothetical protein F5ESL0246_00165 [Lactobacillus sp. ESL0246]RMC34505.1 hypothetical protein F5ESL0245_00165 [Lactobacillus sp. ESL0245]
MFENKLTKKQIMRLIAILQVIFAGIYYYIKRPDAKSIDIIIYMLLGLLFFGLSFFKCFTSGKTIKNNMTKNQKLEQKVGLFVLGISLLCMCTY